jgi:hypothetical protein
MAVATFAVFFAPAAGLVLGLDGTLLWLWIAICLFMSARMIDNLARFAGDRWEVTGAVRGVSPDVTRMTRVSACTRSPYAVSFPGDRRVGPAGADDRPREAGRGRC